VFLARIILALIVGPALTTLALAAALAVIRMVLNVLTARPMAIVPIAIVQHAQNVILLMALGKILEDFVRFVILVVSFATALIV